MSKFIIEERPIVILPTLVRAFGFCEAAIIQKMHYFLDANMEKQRHIHDGKAWTYGTYADWERYLDNIFANSTIRKAVSALEKRGVLISTTALNEHPFDRTKWYSIDYDALKEIEAETVAAWAAKKATEREAAEKAADEVAEAPDTAEQDDMPPDGEYICYQIANESATARRMNPPSDSNSYKEHSGLHSGQHSGKHSGHGAPARDPDPPSREPSPPEPPPPAKPKRQSREEAFVAFVVERGVDEETARCWWRYRDGKPMTSKAWERHCAQAEAAGITPQAAADYTAGREWRAFYANSYLREMEELAQIRQRRSAPQGRVFDQAGNPQGGIAPAGMPQGRTSQMSKGLAIIEQFKKGGRS